LGAHWDGEGTHFALLSRPATAAWLCLFDNEGQREVARLPLERAAPNEKTPDGLWTVTVPAAGPGQVYGFRVAGPFDPAQGLLCDPEQLLFDPYARDYVPSDEPRSVPKARIVEVSFDWQGDRLPSTAWADTVISELHVKGMTALHPLVPAELRGTYLGLAEPCVLQHLCDLGVTAVELLPIFFSLTEERLLDLGLSNYWGYNTLGFLAPDRRFCATDDPVREVKTMVRAFHQAGLEVILDVAYNHTAEGGQGGPISSLKGLDNRGYYRLEAEDLSRYENFSGCGNALDARSATARHLVLESLRYWAKEMRIDGFRFDLAPILGRTDTGFSSQAPFFDEIRKDPTLAQRKLIAEPWDIGPGGYRLGEFPAPWREWNDRYRDAVRSFWRGDPGSAPELARRLTGSSDLFPVEGSETLNFITCHDGFTLRDLVSYEKKHNEANGEANRDGHGHNRSSNGGVEGPSRSPEIRARRAALQRALIGTLALSRGVPMISHGDEMRRTQGGNNNAYCQDSPLTWVNWQPEEDKDHRQFWGQAFGLRRALRGVLEEQADTSSWLHPTGRPLNTKDWHSPNLRAFGWWLESVLLLFNANDEAVSFRLPEAESRQWRVLLESAEPSEKPPPSLDEGARLEEIEVPVQGLTVLSCKDLAL